MSHFRRRCGRQRLNTRSLSDVGKGEREGPGFLGGPRLTDKLSAPKAETHFFCHEAAVDDRCFPENGVTDGPATLRAGR